MMKENKKESYQILEELIEKAKDDSNKRKILVAECKEVFGGMVVDDNVKEFIKYEEKDYSLDKLLSLFSMIKAGILKIKVGEILPKELKDLPTVYAGINFTHDFLYIGYVYPYMTSQPDDEIKAPMLYIKSDSKTKKIEEIEFIRPYKGKKIESDKDKSTRTLEGVNNSIKLSTRNSDDFIMTLEEIEGDDNTFYSGMSLKEYPDGFNDKEFADIMVKLGMVLRLVENLEKRVEGLEVSRISHNGHLTRYIASEIYGSFVIELNGRETIGIAEDDKGFMNLKLENISDFVFIKTTDGYPRAKRISLDFNKLIGEKSELDEVITDDYLSLKSMCCSDVCIKGIKEFRKMRTEIELGE